MPQISRIVRCACSACIILVLCAGSGFGGYKARPWSPRPAESYAAQLTSEGVTIAVEPLYRDDMAAQVFDKNDMVSRGIMPLAVVIFNDNDFPVRVDGASIEVIAGDDHVRTLPPEEVATRIFQKSGKNIFIPQTPRLPGGDRTNPDALTDLEHKFLDGKVVGAHDKGGGFLYFHLPVSQELPAYLSRARVYIPGVYREDNGSEMIFFEIDLKPALGNSPGK